MSCLQKRVRGGCEKLSLPEITKCAQTNVNRTVQKLKASIYVLKHVLL